MSLFDLIYDNCQSDVLQDGKVKITRFTMYVPGRSCADVPDDLFHRIHTNVIEEILNQFSTDRPLFSFLIAKHKEDIVKYCIDNLMGIRDKRHALSQYTNTSIEMMNNVPTPYSVAMIIGFIERQDQGGLFHSVHVHFCKMARTNKGLIQVNDSVAFSRAYSLIEIRNQGTACAY